MPTRRQIQKVKVLVTTLCVAGQLSEMFRNDLNFNTVIIDEAAQATEAETIIGLNLASNNVLLCGDPRQLAPNLRSHDAIRLGTGSLLERLAGNDNCTKIRLTKNFRAHPGILQIASDLFYDGMVKSCLSPTVAEAALGYEDLKGSEFPCVFYSVDGNNDERDTELGFQNTAEAIEVVRVVQKILGSSLITVSTNDLGVVSPYYRQVRLIRNFLRDRGLGSVRVGSVQDYQGQEEKIIVVSAVRSEERNIPIDVANRLGLMFNDRSFNVCITRPQCLLAIVGSSKTLVKDKNFRRLISRCIQNDTFYGLDPDELELEPELSDLVPANYAALGEADHSIDIPWDTAF